MLCDAEILQGMNAGHIGIEPFTPAQLNTNSYDVRLGNYFFVVKAVQRGPIFIGPHYIPDGDPVKITSGGTLLGMTKELIGTRRCMVAELRAKSTTRRMGITVCDDAGFGDIGYWNHWTVELTSHVSNGNPTLIVGERFAQMVFFQTGTPLKEYQGQYNEQDWPLNMVPKKYRDRIVAP